MQTVNFVNVGRNKNCWTAKCKDLSFEWLYSQVKCKGQIMSNDIVFELKAPNIGMIYAGVHPVGMFTLVEE